MLLYYIASPYSHNPPAAYWEAVAAAGYLTRSGFLVYSPIIHYHTIAEQHNLPADVHYWWPINQAMLARSDILLVLQTPEWTASAGVRMEIAWWKENKVSPIQYYTPQQLERLSPHV
jgi:hypothetical protein